MHEEVNQKTIALTVKTAKLTASVLKNALEKFLQAQKNKDNKHYKGKQSVKHLVGQNAGVSNIEITDGNIKSFEKIAKKYSVDFAVKKDKTETPPKYIIFFKSRDVDVLTQAFKEYVHKEMKLKEKPSIKKQLNEYREIIKNNLMKDKVKKKDRGLER
ncbi:PcfB family protein [Clostridium sp. BJN0001]|uniref:PcfB family protein n=1 Tax=Clostridium sp. BJN0001 TaxID=2930219 RepID=UPI001FD58E93|nr:PcfB family protein [Clostridium sp. BJN0001]